MEFNDISISSVRKKIYSDKLTLDSDQHNDTPSRGRFGQKSHARLLPVYPCIVLSTNFLDLALVSVFSPFGQNISQQSVWELI